MNLRGWVKSSWKVSVARWLLKKVERWMLKVGRWKLNVERWTLTSWTVKVERWKMKVGTLWRWDEDRSAASWGDAVEKATEEFFSNSRDIFIDIDELNLRVMVVIFHFIYHIWTWGCGRDTHVFVQILMILVPLSYKCPHIVIFGTFVRCGQVYVTEITLT